jgi:hypothetical protein
MTPSATINASVATEPPYVKRNICPIKLRIEATQNTFSEFLPSKVRKFDKRGAHAPTHLKDPANSAVKAKL